MDCGSIEDLVTIRLILTDNIYYYRYIRHRHLDTSVVHVVAQRFFCYVTLYETEQYDSTGLQPLDIIKEQSRANRMAMPKMPTIYSHIGHFPITDKCMFRINANKSLARLIDLFTVIHLNHLKCLPNLKIINTH